MMIRIQSNEGKQVEVCFLKLATTYRVCPPVHPPTHPSIHLSMATQRFVGPWRFFSFLILYIVGKTPWVGDQPVARPLPIQTWNKCIQTSMPQVGFEPKTPVFRQVKTVHALDHAATVISSIPNCP
jgi:hypothetical protein